MVHTLNITTTDEELHEWGPSVDELFNANIVEVTAAWGDNPMNDDDDDDSDRNDQDLDEEDDMDIGLINTLKTVDLTDAYWSNRVNEVDDFDDSTQGTSMHLSMKTMPLNQGESSWSGDLLEKKTMHL